jgi:hypothetical protein
VVEGVQAAVMEQEDAVGHAADVGELVGRDDQRPGSVVLADGERVTRAAAREQGVVDEEESIGVR